MNQRLQHGYRKACAIYFSPAFVWWIVGFGLVIRLRDYINNRSLWLDESKIATNILTRSFAGLLQPLDFEQGGPVGWLFAMKAVTLACGSSELALRLISLLTGSTALVLFPRVARKFLTRAAVPLAVIFFSFSSLMLYFAIEAKQYITDVFFAVLLLALLPEPGRSKEGEAAPSIRPCLRPYLAIALVGLISIPCSHPAVFTLAGICLTWALLDLKRGRRRALVLHGGIALLWGAAILTNYILFLRALGGSAHLQAFWAEDFMPTAWKLNVSVPWLMTRIYDSFATKPLAFERGGAVGIMFALIGALAIYRRRRMHLMLLLAPLGFVLLAAALRKYPFDSRMILFLVPALLIVVSAGIVALGQWLPARARFVPILLTLFLLWPHFYVAGRTLRDGRKKEEVRAVLARIQAQIQPGDGIFLGPSTAITWRYYTELYPKHFNFSGHPILSYMGNDKNILRALQREQQGGPLPPRIWFLLAHYTIEDRRKLLSRLKKVGSEVPELANTNRGASANVFIIDPARLSAAAR